MSFSYPPLDESEIVLEAANLPYIFREICTSLGVTSPLLSSEASAIIEETNFQPRFKGKHGVTKLRYQFQAFSQSFHGTYREDPPEPKTTLYAIIFRGDEDSFDLQTVKSCSDVILRDHAYDIFRMEWPEMPTGPVVFQRIKQSHGDLKLEPFPEIFTLELQNFPSLFYLSAEGLELYLTDEDPDEPDLKLGSSHELALASDSENTGSATMDSAVVPAALQWRIPSDQSAFTIAREPPANAISGIPPREIRLPIQFGANAADADRPPFRQPRLSATTPNWRQSIAVDEPERPLPPTGFGHSEFVRTSDRSPSARSRGDDATDAPMTALMQYLLAERREDRADRAAEAEQQKRRDEQQTRQHREDAQQHRADMMHMMSVALTAQASPPPSPVRPIAVISTK